MTYGTIGPIQKIAEAAIRKLEQNTEPGKLFCGHCGQEIDDYHADLKCPACRCDLDGEALKAMQGYKAYLVEGQKIVPVHGHPDLVFNKATDRVEPLKGNVDPSLASELDKHAESMKNEMIMRAAIDRYNAEVADAEFMGKMAAMDAQEMSKDIDKARVWRRNKEINKAFAKTTGKRRVT